MEVFAPHKNRQIFRPVIAHGRANISVANACSNKAPVASGGPLSRIAKVKTLRLNGYGTGSTPSAWAGDAPMHGCVEVL